MTREYIVHQDQAVWERQTFTIVVPDEIAEDDIDEYLRERAESGEVQPDSQQILCNAVESLDIQYSCIKNVGVIPP